MVHAQIFPMHVMNFVQEPLEHAKTWSVLQVLFITPLLRRARSISFSNSIGCNKLLPLPMYRFCSGIYILRSMSCWPFSKTSERRQSTASFLSGKLLEWGWFVLHNWHSFLDNLLQNPRIGMGRPKTWTTSTSFNHVCLTDQYLHVHHSSTLSYTIYINVSNLCDTQSSMSVRFLNRTTSTNIEESMTTWMDWGGLHFVWQCNMSKDLSFLSHSYRLRFTFQHAIHHTPITCMFLLVVSSLMHMNWYQRSQMQRLQTTPRPTQVIQISKNVEYIYIEK